MKRLILAVVGLGALIGLALAVSRPKTAAVSEMEKEAEAASVPTRMEPQTVKRAGQLRQGATQPKGGAEGSLGGPAAAEGHFDFDRAIDTLVSRRASFREKQAAWDGLKEAGQLDQAISELEQRMTDDPQSADLAAALGTACLKKCATMT